MLESSIEGTVVYRAERAGWFVRKVQWPGRRGAPDRVFAKKGHGTIWIEFKQEGKAPNTLQRREHKRMRDAGMVVHVVDRIDDALRILGLLGNRHNGGPRL